MMFNSMEQNLIKKLEGTFGPYRHIIEILSKFWNNKPLYLSFFVNFSSESGRTLDCLAKFTQLNCLPSEVLITVDLLVIY